jgi:hypothetical protein
VRRRQGLFDLSASLNFETCLNPDVPDWRLYSVGNFLSPANPPVAVPFQQISLGCLGCLDADGHLWTIQPDGTELVITPKTVSALSVFSNPSIRTVPASSGTASIVGSEPPQQKQNLRIQANGITLEPDQVVTNAQFCVGQEVVFAPAWDQQLSGIQTQTCVWSFGGRYFNNESNAVAGGSMPNSSFVPYLDSTRLTNTAATNYWVSGGFWRPATYTAHVDVSLVFTNGKAAHVSIDGLFTMARPKAKITTTTGTISVTSAWGDLELAFGTTNRSGIVFSNTITMPDGFSGSTEWVQAVNERLDTRLRASDGKWEQQETSGLDEWYPYGGGAVAADSPGAQLTDALLEYKVVTDSYTMWLLFQPDSSPSHWVPLRAVDWYWRGSATNGPSGWELESGTATNSVNPQDYPTELFPRWTSNVTNATWITLP